MHVSIVIEFNDFLGVSLFIGIGGMRDSQWIMEDSFISNFQVVWEELILGLHLTVEKFSNEVENCEQLYANK